MNKNLRVRSTKIMYYLMAAVILSPVGVNAAALQHDSVPDKPSDTLKTYTRLPEHVPVLYGVQSRERLVQSIGYLNGQRLETSPVTLLSNNFGGQMAGLYVNQTNGAPRFDNPELMLRGRTPLIVIDGVPRYNLISQDNTVVTSGQNNQTLYDVLSINPEQIESITLLKDALSTAMLGNRGMDGVLMITTRKANAGKTSSVTFTGQAGVQTPIGMRRPLSAYDYASLYNEASVNSGGQAVFSPAQLAAYQNGNDPYAYPNVDWRSTVLKKNAPLQRYTLTADGNYSNIRYFFSLDYQAQGGLINEDPNTSYGTNVDYKRYVFRSNIDINLDKRLSASFNLVGNIQDFYQPGVGYGAVFNSILNTPANAIPVYNFTGSYAGNQQYTKNPYAQAVATGYLKNNLQAASADIALKRMMDDVIKGSWVKALVSYSPSYEQQIDRSKSYDALYYPVTGDTTQHMRVNTISDQLNASSIIERFQQTYVEFSMGIDRNWNKNAISGTLLASYENSQNDNLLNNEYKNVAGRVNYSYDGRFNIEAAASYSGNNWFAPGHQYDFYPAVGASWNIERESFFKQGGLINTLKLRASYGKVGNANPGYYVYNQAYVSGPAYFFGTGATNSPSIFQDDLANPNRITEKANKLNVGFDLSYSQNRGWLSVDYYDNHEYDLLQIRGASSPILGQVYPLENIGKDRFYGIEVNAGWANKVGDLGYSISGNFSTVASKIIYNDEPAVAYPYMMETGNPVNQIRGYVADGFFSAGNLTGATLSGYIPVAGDVRYRDLNSDGVINQNDITVIGNKKPLLFYGASFTLNYKGFDLSALVQGVANRDILTVGNYEYPFTNNGLGQAFDFNLNRYTPQTAATANLPRVTLGTDKNNYIASSLFVRNGNFIRLKNAEIGYSFSTKFLTAAKIKRMRIFISGQNLLTASKYKESDPEDFMGLYPIQRIINGGLSVKF